jgi:2-methylcitrate dehydratase PrpD
MTITTRLATHFAAVDYRAIGTAQRHEMKRLLLDHLGVGIAGAATDSGRIVGEFVVAQGGVGEAHLLGRAERVPAISAALANGVASHSLELDDVDELALFHYGPPVYAAALAVGERAGASGIAVIDAALAGCEMMARLSRATNPSLRDRGFHTTPTCGAFGAAVAAGRLLGLDASQLLSALGLAGTQASGLMEMYGPSMQKRFNVAPAARNGVTAALLAERGFTGADSIIDGPRGFGHAFTDSFDPDPLLDELGTRVPVLVEYKPYSCARPIHNAIDCVLGLRAAHGITPGDVTDILVLRHPAWSEYHRNPRPRTYHEAQVSLPWSVAVALADGVALPEQYRDERLDEKELVRVARAVRIETDPDLPRGVSCRMVLRTATAEYETQVDHPLGSIERPLSDDALVAKFTALTAPCLPAGRPTEIVELAFDADDIDDIGLLLARCH